jgi:hypothetical protein
MKISITYIFLISWRDLQGLCIELAMGDVAFIYEVSC